jgi:hypothetical protein
VNARRNVPGLNRRGFLAAWTSTGSPHEPRDLRHRADGAICVVPIPAVLVRMFRQYLRQSGTAPDGRLFRSARSGCSASLSTGVPGTPVDNTPRRQAALGPDLSATLLARRSRRPRR